MNDHARERVLAEIGRQAAAGGEVAVPASLFFAGNDDPRSIVPGAERPPVSVVAGALAALAAREEVQAVLVRAYEPTEEGAWPFTDTIYVITSLPKEAVTEALAPARLEEAIPDWLYGKPKAAPDPAPGMLAYTLWWD